MHLIQIGISKHIYSVITKLVTLTVNQTDTLFHISQYRANTDLPLACWINSWANSFIKVMFLPTCVTL